MYPQTTLGDPYKAANETYYKILVPEKNSKGKGFRKDYLWVVVGINTKMIYLLYNDGSQSELEKSKSIYEYGSYVYYETGSPAFWQRHCQLSVSGKIPDVTCPVPAVDTCRNSCRTWKVCQNAHLLFFTHKAPTFTSWGFVIT